MCSRNLTLTKMSLLNSGCTDMHQSSPGGNLSDNILWPETAEEHVKGGWNTDSILASVMHDYPQSCVDENETVLSSEGQASSADFCIADLPQICMTSDGLKAAYGDLSDTGDDPSSMMVSATFSQSGYHGHQTMQLVGSGGRSHHNREFRQVSIPETGLATSQAAEYGGLARKNTNPHGDGHSSHVPFMEFEAPRYLGLQTSTRQQPPAASGTVASSMRLPNKFSMEVGVATDRWPASALSQSPMASDDTVSSGWRAHMVDVAEFVDLSDFLSPRLTSSRHLTEGQQVSLGMHRSLESDPELQMSTAKRRPMMASAQHRAPAAFGMSTIQNMKVQEQLRQFPRSLAQDESTPETVQNKLARPSFVASSNPASSSGVLASTVEQLYKQWKSASPSFMSPKLHPPQTPKSVSDPDHENIEGKSVKPGAPVTPEKPRERLKHNRTYKQEGDQNQQNPVDSSKCSASRKHPTSVPPVVAFQSDRVKVPGEVVFAATKDLTKARDHVARERRRRDLMNSRYLSLESLLPKLSFRRDRYSIVHDTKQYVKDMELRLADLKATRQDYQARLEAGKQQEQAKAAVPETAAAPSEAGVPHSSRSKDLNVGVVMYQKFDGQEIVISVQSRSKSGAKLFGSLLQAMEKLELNVCQLSTSKSAQFFICNAVCKPQQHVVWSHLSSEKLIQEMVTTLRPLSRLEGSTRP